MRLEGSKLTSTATDPSGNYTFSDLRVGGSYTIIPEANVNFTPPNRSFNNLTRDGSADFTVEVFKISGRVMSLAGPLRNIKISLEGSRATSATTDTNGYYAFANLREGGSYTITPRAQLKFDPPNRFLDRLRRDESVDFFQPDATPTPTPTPTPSPSPSPKPECSDDERSRTSRTLIDRFGAGWRRRIEGDRSRIIEETAKPFLQGAEATLGPIEYQISFFKNCSAAAVSANYVWQVRILGPAGAKTVTVAKRKTFGCFKFLGMWQCN